MANPDRQTKPKIYRTEQDVQNSSFDESYQVTATEMLVENSAQTALVRLNEDMLGGGTGTAAYSDASDVSKKGLVDADRHVQVDVLTMPQPTAPSSVVNGQKTVTTAGTQVAIAASTAVAGVIVQALSTNTGLIYVGDSSVSSTTGFELQPGQATSVAIDNLSKVYVDSTVNGEGVSFIGS